MKFLTGEWIKAALDDLLIIEEIINNELLTHLLAFHAQQAVEKLFKALLEENEIKFPKVHGLIKLFSLIENIAKFKVDKDQLKLLDQLYIDARYPGDLGLLPNGKPTLDEAKVFYDLAKDIQKRTGIILK